MLIGLAVSFRHLDRSAVKHLLSWRYVAFAQFYAFFFINAALYPFWEGTREHARAVALESWSVGLLCLVVLALWAHVQKSADVKRALIGWLPVGLTLAFVIATLFYFSGTQGARIPLFTPNALVPPFWFLVLCMASFVWFFEMNFWHRLWRLALFFMAGMMVVYGSARLVMLAWGLCGAATAIWFSTRSALEHRRWVLLGTSLIIVACVVGVLLADVSSGGLVLTRMAEFFQVELTYDSISTQFVRLKIWAGALSVIADHPFFGIGKVNERIALNQELGWDKWLRAHQTYLSFLIAGGIPALISGLLMQSPVLAFLRSAKRAAFFPAFLGLGVVVTMNCFTDSIFQSAVAVQVFMVTTLLFLKASDADQPTLAPQKHVSPAII